MSVKNFREDIDIKPGVAAGLKPAAPETFAVDRAEIRTMAKDLAMVRTRLPQKGKVSVAGEGPKSVLGAELFQKEPISSVEPLPAPVAKPPLAPPPRPAPKPEIMKEVTVPRPTPAAVVRPVPRPKIKQPAPPIFEQRTSASFVRVFFEALLAVVFFGLLIAGVAYWWNQIQETQQLITQPPVVVRVPPALPVAVNPIPSLLVADQTQEIVFPAVPDAATLRAQLDGVRRSTIRPGEFLRLLVLTSDRAPVDAQALAAALSVPLPAQPCSPSDATCAGAGVPYPISSYTLFVFGESPTNAIGAVAHVDDSVSPDALQAADNAWEGQLAAYVRSAGLTPTMNQFESSRYREAQIRYLNFNDGSALDVIFIPSQRLLAFTTSRESAFRLIDRVLLNSSISYPQVIP